MLSCHVTVAVAVTSVWCAVRCAKDGLFLPATKGGLTALAAGRDPSGGARTTDGELEARSEFNFLPAQAAVPGRWSVFIGPRGWRSDGVPTLAPFGGRLRLRWEGTLKTSAD